MKNSVSKQVGKKVINSRPPKHHHSRDHAMLCIT